MVTVPAVVIAAPSSGSGKTTVDPAAQICGVVPNRVGTTRHEEMLRQACDTAEIVIPGDSPEQYPVELAANVVLRRKIRDLAPFGPVHTECAGLTYLVSKLDGRAMCGVLSGQGTLHQTPHTGLPRRRRRLTAVCGGITAVRT